MILPIAVPGTSESHPGDTRTEMPDPSVSMLTNVTDHLDPDIFLPGRFVGYPAAYGDPMSYEESVAEGIDNLEQVVYQAMQDDQKMVLLGYSQGATIVRRYLAAVATGVYGDPAMFHGVILGAGCVADPYRPKGNCLGIDPGGFGLAGKTTVWPDGFLYEVAATRDPICAAPENSYLRTVADFTGYMTTDPSQLILWMQAMITTLRDVGWQNANLDWGQFWLTGQRVNEAVDYAGGYLPRVEYRVTPWMPPVVINPGGGRHTCYGVETMPGSQLTYCQALADAINQAVMEVAA